jgi:hypothetical protein
VKRFGPKLNQHR